MSGIQGAATDASAGSHVAIRWRSVQGVRCINARSVRVGCDV